MGTPYMGELRIVSFGYAPKGWALCNGQLMPINQNQALFSLLGVTYGGDGRVTFGLPDMRDRTAIHFGSGYIQGEKAGEANHTITTAEMAQHTHFVQGSSAIAGQIVPTGNLLGVNQVDDIFSTSLVSPIALHPAAVTNTGGSQPHNNLQPYLTLNFCIALQGIFPSRN